MKPDFKMMLPNPNWVPDDEASASSESTAARPMAGPCDAPTCNKNGCHSIGHPVLPLPFCWNWRPPHIAWSIHHLLIIVVSSSCRRCRVMQSPCSSPFHYVLRWLHISASRWLPLHLLTSPNSLSPCDHQPPWSTRANSRVNNLRASSSSSWLWWLLLLFLLLLPLCLSFHPYGWM